MSWGSAKEDGNELFANRQYNDAIEKYSYAIQVLHQDPDLTVDLARLYSNRAAAYLQLAFTVHDSEQLECLRLSLADGHSCIKFDPIFEKGHFRVAKALYYLNHKTEGLDHLTRIIQLHKERGTSYTTDKVLLNLLKDYKYWRQRKVLMSYNAWEQVKHKDRYYVVDQHGAGDLDSLQTPINFMSRVSFIVLPGVYTFREKGLIIKPEQEVDIVGLCDEDEDVIFETSGTEVPSGVVMDHTVTVVNGQLSLTNITVKQSFNHSERHGILVVKGGKCFLGECKLWSRASGCVAVNDPGSKLIMKKCLLNECCGGVIICGKSKVIIDQCKILNSARIGVEIRDGGFATIKDTEVSYSGRQGLVCHAYGEGFHVQRCTFQNNSRQFGENEAAISVVTGKVSVIECQINNNKGTGLGLDSGAHCMVKDCEITGSRVALALCHGCSAHIANNRITDNTFGITILYNMEKDVVMENNTIKATSGEVMLSKEDNVPTMTGVQHKVDYFSHEIGEQMLTDKLRMIMKQKKINKFNENNPGLDPRHNPHPNQIRMCPGCGLSEEAKQHVFKKCSVCKVTFYCSAECQKKDWAIHKQQCKVLSAVYKK